MTSSAASSRVSVFSLSTICHANQATGEAHGEHEAIIDAGSHWRPSRLEAAAHRAAALSITCCRYLGDGGGRVGSHPPGRRPGRRSAEGGAGPGAGDAALGGNHFCKELTARRERCSDSKAMALGTKYERCGMSIILSNWKMQGGIIAAAGADCSAKFP